VPARTEPYRRRLLLLCGGRSGEHEVSLSSAASVLAAAEGRLDVDARVIARNGRLLSDAASRVALERGRSDGQSEGGASPTLLHGLATLDLFSYDAVFPLLHGPNGEDGTVQGLLEVADVPFVGSSVLGSAAAMDKIVMKRLFASDGLPQVAWSEVHATHWRTEPGQVLTELETLPWPRFVKPANLGSSVGISRASDRESLRTALNEAFRYDRRVIVEEGVVNAREIEVAVLGNEAPVASPAGEIRVPADAYYDYQHKYTDGMAELVIPAELPASSVETVRALALQAFQLVDAAGLARVDLFVRPDGELLVNEINTIPGFTRHSMYPRLMDAAGVPYPQLIERLVELGIERHAARR